MKKKHEVPAEAVAGLGQMVVDLFQQWDEAGDLPSGLSVSEAAVVFEWKATGETFRLSLSLDTEED